MKTEAEIIFVADNISGHYGIPTRVYRGMEQIEFFPFIPLVADPFLLCEDDLTRLSGPIDWIVTNEFFYGVVSNDNYHVVMGPLAEKPDIASHFPMLAESLRLSGEDAALFVEQLESLTLMSVSMIVSLLSIVNFSINGEMIRPNDVPLGRLAPSQQGSEFLNNLLSSNTASPHSPALELRMPAELISDAYITAGNEKALRYFLDHMPVDRFIGRFSDDPLYNARLSMVYALDRVVSVAVSAGLPYRDAKVLHDQYLARIKTLKSPESILELRTKLLLNYAHRIHLIRESLSFSRIVREAMEYIQNNLSSTIRTDDIARSLFISRSRLSTVFKKETGCPLSDYIHLQKIKVGKELLAHSSSSIADISTQLGYKSQSHFSSVFRRYTGITPSNYRDKYDVLSETDPDDPIAPAHE